MSFFTASSSRCCQFDAVVDAILYMLYAVYAVFDSNDLLPSLIGSDGPSRRSGPSGIRCEYL